MIRRSVDDLEKDPMQVQLLWIMPMPLGPPLDTQCSDFYFAQLGNLGILEIGNICPF